MKKCATIFNQDLLKIIALTTMTCDHVGKILFEPICVLLTQIGRLSFPIFAYILILHLYNKQNYRQYIDRLFVFGLITQIVLWPFTGFANNILWSFLLVVVCIHLLQEISFRIRPKGIRITLYVLMVICCLIVSVPLDYSFLGFAFMLSLYGLFKYKTALFVILTLIFSMLMNGDTGTDVTISLLTTMLLLLSTTGMPIQTYFPQMSQKRLIHDKWFFYIYYPAHLVVLYGLKAMGILF